MGLIIFLFIDIAISNSIFLRKKYRVNHKLIEYRLSPLLNNKIEKGILLLAI